MATYSIIRRAELYIALMMFVALLMFIPYYYETDSTKALSSEISKWTSVMAGFYTIYGGIMMYRSHIRTTYRKTSGWIWSVWLLFWLTLTSILGIASLWFSGADVYYSWIASYINSPINRTMYCLLFFFVISATVKAFTFRSTEVSIIIITTILYYLRFAPITYAIFPWAAFPGEFIANTMAPAGKMARALGAGILTIGLGMRQLLGVERAWLGRIRE